MDAPLSAPTEDYDSPWKDVLTLFFPEFMAFFFPEVHAEIDWPRGFEFLDKEMQRLSAKAAVGRRTVDKLVRVWRKNGDELCVLIHIEVQGQREAGFTQRIFVYQYRLFDHRKTPVASFVILTDDDPNWRPGEYRTEIFGTELSLKFPAVKLSDFRARLKELEQSDDPFAIVVRVQLAATDTHGDPEGRFWRKLGIAKQLYGLGWGEPRVLALFEFLDGLLRLPDEMDKTFHDKLTEFKEEQEMKYVTSFERIGIKKGYEMGSAEMVLRILCSRYGSLDETIETQVRALPLKHLEALGDVLPDLDTPADLQMWLLHRSSLPVTELPATSGSLELDS